MPISRQSDSSVSQTLAVILTVGQAMVKYDLEDSRSYRGQVYWVIQAIRFGTSGRCVMYRSARNYTI